MRLKELRIKKGYTQQQMADFLNVTQAAYSGWENEKYEPNSDVLIEISKIFRVSIDYILEISNEPLPVPAEELDAWFSEFMSLDEEIQQVVSTINFKEVSLIEDFRTLNVEGQEKVLDITDDLVKSGKYAISSTAPAIPIQYKAVARSKDDHEPRIITAEEMARIENAPKEDLDI